MLHAVARLAAARGLPAQVQPRSLDGLRRRHLPRLRRRIQRAGEPRGRSTGRRAPRGPCSTPADGGVAVSARRWRDGARAGLCGSRTRCSPPRARSATASSTTGILDLSTLGGIVSKGLYLEPRDGCDVPRIVETPSGLLNAIGLQGVGVRSFVRDVLPAARARTTPPCVVNVCGDTVEEYAEVTRILEDAPGVDALEINISCPNVKKGGHGLRRRSADDARGGGRRAQGDAPPVIPKLSPERRPTSPCSRAPARRRGPTRSPASTRCSASWWTSSGGGRGWPSAPAASRAPPSGPIAVRMAWQAARAVTIPVIGIGGIASARGRARVPDRGLPRGADRHRELRGPGVYDARHGRAHRLPRAPRPGATSATWWARCDVPGGGCEMTPRERLIVALDVPDGRRGARARRPAVRRGRACSRSAASSSPPRGPTSCASWSRAASTCSSTSSSTTSPTRSPARSRAPASSGVSLVDVHGLGGSAMMAAAAAGALPAMGCRLLAITVLTSHDEASLGEIGVPGAHRRIGGASGARWRRTREPTASSPPRTRSRSSARPAGPTS